MPALAKAGDTGLDALNDLAPTRQADASPSEKPEGGKVLEPRASEPKTSDTKTAEPKDGGKKLDAKDAAPKDNGPSKPVQKVRVASSATLSV